jgi:DNA invertase Pin-like site-specific DNA recombinase
VRLAVDPLAAGFFTRRRPQPTPEKKTPEKKFDKARIQGEHGIADGRVLGYRNVGPVKQRQRVVDPEEKALVVRIFEMSADGMGYLKIATTLNREGAKIPTVPV